MANFIFELPHAFNSQSSAVDNARNLRILLNTLIELNSAFLKGHTVQPLYKAGVTYGRTFEWDTIPALYAKRYGDCKSLSAALIAERRALGRMAEPVFRFAQGKTGNLDFHILVQTEQGYEDPSKVLGMTLDENQYFQNKK